MKRGVLRLEYNCTTTASCKKLCLFSPCCSFCSLYPFSLFDRQDPCLISGPTGVSLAFRCGTQPPQVNAAFLICTFILSDLYMLKLPKRHHATIYLVPKSLTLFFLSSLTNPPFVSLSQRHHCHGLWSDSLCFAFCGWYAWLCWCELFKCVE